MTTERVLHDVPDDDVDELVSDFESEGCTVNIEPQDDGLWTVRALCPEDDG